MIPLYDWPKATRFGRVVPKSKIYAHASATTALKSRFVNEVDQINWAHKLAPETLNLPATKRLREVQVFRVPLKTPNCHDTVLRAIDRAIPFPLIFELTHGGRIQVAAAYKRPSEADSTKWVLGEHFRSDWLAAGTPRTPLPVAVDMARLYEALLGPLIPVAPKEGEPLQARLDRAAMLKAKETEINRLKSRLKYERQFNRRVEINGVLREAQAEFEHLKAGN
ncbi:MAG TPA: DUF4391 domain-containing protein [Rhizobiales bacterium]|nr:DUF4391 domain-containing protein [Hyphomicrobiales bacterium]